MIDNLMFLLFALEMSGKENGSVIKEQLKGEVTRVVQ